MGQLLRFALVVGGLPLALLIAVTVLSEGSPFRLFSGPGGGRSRLKQLPCRRR